MFEKLAEDIYNATIEKLAVMGGGTKLTNPMKELVHKAYNAKRFARNRALSVIGNYNPNNVVDNWKSNSAMAKVDMDALAKKIMKNQPNRSKAYDSIANSIEETYENRIHNAPGGRDVISIIDGKPKKTYQNPHQLHDMDSLFMNDSGKLDFTKNPAGHDISIPEEVLDDYYQGMSALKAYNKARNSYKDIGMIPEITF